MKYGGRRALTGAEINRSVTRLLLMTFIDAALRAFPPSRYPYAGLNALINKPCELIAVLRVPHYTSCNIAFITTRVLFDKIV